MDLVPGWRTPHAYANCEVALPTCNTGANAPSHLFPDAETNATTVGLEVEDHPVK